MPALSFVGIEQPKLPFRFDFLLFNYRHDLFEPVPAWTIACIIDRSERFGIRPCVFKSLAVIIDELIADLDDSVLLLAIVRDSLVDPA